MNVPLTSQAISRRRLLQMGGVTALTMGVPGTVAARVDPAKRDRGPAEKSCIFVLLCGGPSHLDMWDLKPDAPAEIRGPYKPAQTTVPGVRICELQPRLAQMADKFALVRSMTHPGNISNHFDAMHNLLAGQHNAPQDAAYLGSVLSKVRPSQKALASYVWLIKCVGDPVFCAPNIGTGGNLGSFYAPLFAGDANNNPALPNFKPPEALLPVDTTERLNSRSQLLGSLNRGGRSESDASQQSWRDVQRRGFEIATSDGPREAFNLGREDVKLRDRYGRNPLGQNLLLARRLVESGVGFVTVNGWTGPAPGQQGGGPPSSSWDMHGGEMGMGNAFGNGSYGLGWCLPCLDEGLSALLTDLHDRGMLENTMVVVTGEFGRTPIINERGTTPGRQHWPKCFSSIIAGGNIRGGAVYGETDKHGAYVKDRPVRPQDLGATIFHHLEVPLDLRLSRDGFTRPVSSGEPIRELFG